MEIQSHAFASFGVVQVMARYLKRLLLLTLVVELILPVGWCCRPGDASATTSSVNAATGKACCGGPEKRTSKPAKSQSPAPPISKCCCSADSVVPERAALPVGIDSMPALNITLPAVDCPRDVLHLVDRRAFQTGPPLNVLLCVWVC